MFRVKICGITNVEDAMSAVISGADAIGLNFYRKSPRYISVEQAAEICNAVKGRSKCVGVFVNAAPDQIEDVLKDANLDGVQLHGDELPTVVAYLSKLLTPPLTRKEKAIEQEFAALAEEAKGLNIDVDNELISELTAEALHSLRETYDSIKVSPVIRARRMTDEGVAAIAADLQACRKAGGAPGALLVDAFTPGRYGGTGETTSWAGLSDYTKWLGNVPLILAGGLTPDNVADAIRIVRPHGVDVASGVESAPGKKDHDKIKAFVEAARSAY